MAISAAAYQSAGARKYPAPLFVRRFFSSGRLCPFFSTSRRITARRAGRRVGVLDDGAFRDQKVDHVEMAHMRGDMIACRLPRPRRRRSR